MENPLRHFAELTDARVERTKDTHSREFIAIAAGLCGAETWNDIEFYGKTKRELAEEVSSAAQRHSFARHF